MAREQVTDPIRSGPVPFKDRVPGALLVTQASDNGEGRIVDANRDLLDMFECETLEELKEFSNDSYFGLVYPDDIGTLRWYVTIYYGELHAAGIRHKLWIRYRIRTKSGKIIPVSETARVVDDETQGRLIYRTIERSEEGTSTAYQDDLTGLLTMHGFYDTINMQRRSGMFEPASYIYFNLTHFKRFNMQYGYDEGNVYLCRIASILKKSFGPEAVIARFTADQFAVYTTEPQALQQIQKAHDEIAVIRPEVTSELKAGIYEISSEMKDIPINLAGDLAKNACDAIMNDPNRFMQIYDQQIADEVQMQEYIAENIDTAIRNGYIRVYYQPVVRSLTGTLCGFEALSRWEDPTYGFLNPKDFITTLEENHLIHKLDLYVLEQICKQIRSEIVAGRTPVPVSFNLSRADIMMCDIFERVEKIVKHYGVDRDMIRIEITESMIMKDPMQMQMVITRFRKAGYQVWMDDFGSGYSSLNMLKDFAFDELKLDMEFLHSSTPESREIIASSVQMVKNIGIHTLAEGVETREQTEFLRSIGCEKMQGYYYGKPAPYMESYEHCTVEERINVEKPRWNRYMDQVGRVNLQTDQALGIFQCCKEKKETAPESCLLYANSHFEKIMQNIGCQVIGYPMEAKGDALLHRIDKYLCRNTWADDDPRQELTMSTSQNGHALRITFTQLGHLDGIRTYSIQVSDLTRTDQFDQGEMIDAVLRNLMNFYLNAYILYLDKDYMIPVHPDHCFREHEGTRYPDINGQARKTAIENISEEDQERFLQFLDRKTLLERIEAAPHHLLQGGFLAKLGDGTYHFVLLSVVQAAMTRDKIALIAVREVPAVGEWKYLEDQAAQEN